MKTAELKKIIDKHTTCASDFDAIWNAVKETLADSHPTPMSAEQVEAVDVIKGFVDSFRSAVMNDRQTDAYTDALEYLQNQFPTTPSVKADGWVIPDNVTLKDIKAVRDYFGEHDKSPFEHRAFDVMNKLVDYFTPHQNNNYKQ